ncbi:GNAT family N-acetyltransferase [Thalassococcus sp. S3]|uniref:GNAT family N-acetyltransferase n=1 Tax=Thalassococcus sp. S3 TaxID=2017482 RepID=UPI00102431EE|nr:GNAT family N-acetyltransferase [Thalassococcus sp. S3]QBF31305.1 GNAT family N-acetyltransferase [Thalassococcus sp. S3]
MSLAIHPVTPERWEDLETLFASASATRNCWCMWWRIAGNAWRDTTKTSRKADFQTLVETGPPPGLLAYDDDRAVGWVQVSPRSDIPRFNNGRTSKPEPGADLAKVWALSCFFTASGYRGQGLMERLARAACDWAASQGAETVEAAAYAPARPLQRSEGYVGLVVPLTRAGFKPVAQRSDVRVLMRWHAEREPK